MKNKRLLATALTVIFSLNGVLYGCDSSESQSSSDSENNSVSQSVSAKTPEDKKLTLSSDNLSKNDKVYYNYLIEQKFCNLRKDFRIIEAGAVKNSPNGLAGAVKFDFDEDGTDELVVFTFDRNNNNGEDIRIDLLKPDGDSLKLTDSKYLTEILDMDIISDTGTDLTDNSIYFTKNMSMQIVTSEYQNKLYFGSLLTYENLERDGIDTSSYIKTFNVFGVEDNKIVPYSIGAFDIEKDFYRADPTKEGLLYARTLPPSIRDSATFSECTVSPDSDESYKKRAEQLAEDVNNITTSQNKYNMFTLMQAHLEGNYKVTGGMYSSLTSAFSAMLNEFGLDIEYIQPYIGSESNTGFSASFVSKNQSEMKEILRLEAIRDYDGYYSANRYILDSDIETILGDDAVFTESFANETELYTDIFKYPYYYRNIWDSFVNSCEETCYFIADINQDSKKELVIIGQEGETVSSVSVIKSDLTIINAETDGDEISFYDNGLICVCQHYSDSYNYIDTNSGDIFNGDEAKKKISEISANAIFPEMNSYNIRYSDTLNNLNIIENTEDIKKEWQEAYIYAIDDFSNHFSADFSKDELSYKLIYIDGDDIPELYISNTIYGESLLYTYFNGKATIISESFSPRDNSFGGYMEKSGMFLTHSSGGASNHIETIHKISNGFSETAETLVYDENDKTSTYKLNDEGISKEEYDKKSEDNQKYFKSENVSYTYDEILKIFNGETVEKTPEVPQENISSESDTATVKAGGGLNMRSGAGKEFDKVTLIPDGSEVEVLERQSEWSKVRYADFTGWVNNNYLK